MVDQGAEMEVNSRWGHNEQNYWPAQMHGVLLFGGI